MIRIPAEDLDHVLTHTAHLWPELRGPIFITGGTGFVGTWLVETMLWASDRLSRGLEATLLTRDPEAFARKAPHLAAHSSITLLRGDQHSFEYPPGEFPLIIHGATEQHRAPTPEQPLSTFQQDVEATLRVLEFARTHGTRRLLFTSSGAMYGKQPAELTHIPETYSGAPVTTDIYSAYGQAKRISEFYCALYASQYGFAALLARLFAFVGPHLPLDLAFAVGNFIGDVMNGGPVRIGGDGTPYRSYLYAADLAIWLWTILAKGASARAYNVGSADDLTIAELARAVVANTVPSTRIEVAREPVPGAPAVRYVPNVDRAREELGLESLIKVEEGIRRTYAWHRGAAG